MPIRLGRMGMRATRTERRKRIQARRRAKVGRANMRSAFARKVLRIVNRTEETKYVANAYAGDLTPLANQWYSVGSLAAAGSWNPAIPAVTQGTDDYQRVGNKIHPTNVAVSLKVGFDPENIQAASLLGVIYYGVSKEEKNWGANTPIGAADILDDGDGTTSPFGGQRFKLMYPIDKKEYSIKRITFRLSKTEGIQNADISGASVTQGNFSTSNGLSEKSFLLKFKAPKSLLYKSGTTLWPTNYAPFFGVGFCHADGSALEVADQKLVTVNSRCHMYFKDA